MKRIRTRMIVACLFVALLPAIPLSLVVRNLLERSFSSALDASLEEALTAGLTESRERLQEQKQRFRAAIDRDWLPRVAAGDSAVCQADDDKVHYIRRIINLEDIYIEDYYSSALPADVNPCCIELRRWRAEVRKRPADCPPGGILAGPERVGECLAVAIAAPSGQIIIVAQLLPAFMVGRAERMTSALTLLRALRQDRSAILRSYAVPFLLIYAVLLLIALAVGALLARRIARPIESLVASTQQVAAGDLETRVEATAPGEVGELVTSFNRMVGRLSQQRRELARLERVAAWRDLARTLAHEIKNPLTPILLSVQAARESYLGDDDNHARMLGECEEIVSEEVEGLRCLVQEFSEFARLPQPTPASGDLAALLREMVRLYGEDRVVCEVSGGGLPAFFDAAELRRALINLIDNGLAACSGAGRPERVVLAAEVKGDHVLLEVRDQGGGITPENLSRIFEPNFSTKKEGMGLGLPIVEGIITGHGGSIEVRSESGSGTTFVIRLPAGDEVSRDTHPAGQEEERS